MKIINYYNVSLFLLELAFSKLQHTQRYVGFILITNRSESIKFYLFLRFVIFCYYTV